VVAAFALARLLDGARRPLLGALAGAVCLTGNVLTGRTAFALGLAAGLPALLAVRSRRTATAGLLAALAAAMSPVAGVFTGVAAVALLVTGRRRDGLAIGVGTALPLLLTGVVFGQGGDATIHWYDVWTGGLLSLAVLFAAPQRAVRVGAALTVLGLGTALLLTTPVGHNAGRLALVLAVPLVLALAPWRPVVVGAVVTAMVVLRPPLSVTDLRRAGDEALTASFTAPVVAELARRAPTGRVEAVPLREHAEALYLSEVAPLARGWLRQQDTLRAQLFYDGTLDAQTYRSWLRDSAVQYVVLADSWLDGAGRAEAELVRSGLPYLTEVWRSGAWTLYELVDPVPLAEGATVLGSTAQSLTLRVDTPREVRVHVRESRWLTLSGPGCLLPDGRWLRLRAERAGTFVLSSALQLRPAAAC